MTTSVVPHLTVREAAERRRAIRAYESGPLPRADVEAILRIAALAPSAFNLQPWRFVVVEREDLRTRISEAAGQQRQTVSAPAIVVLYTDTADSIATADAVVHPGNSPERRARARAAIDRQFSTQTDAERETWGAAQGYIALGYLLLAAESLGYQTSPMLGFDVEKVKAALGLPTHVRVPALIAIGHGAEEGLPHHRHPLERIARFV